MDVEDAARRHVERFNDAVRSGEWGAFCAGFADDATMSFVGVPVGHFAGRAEIEAAYLARPPTSTMTIRDVRAVADDEADISFRWDDDGGSGRMSIRWRDDRVLNLSVAFD